MLTDFLHAKRVLGQMTNDFLALKIRQYLGPLNVIPERRLMEGDAFSHGSSVNNSTEVPFTTTSAEVQMDIEQAKLNPTYIFMQLNKIAADYAFNITSHSFQTLKDATQSAGTHQTIGQITPEVVLDMWRRMHISFTEDGNPVLPDIVTFNPVMQEEFTAANTLIEADPALKQQKEEIINAKKRFWDDRESNRQLVD